jgi:hypothetical protein
MSSDSLPIAPKRSGERCLLSPGYTAILMALSVRGKRSFSPVICIRMNVFKVNAMPPNQWETSFSSDSQAFLALYALNVGPTRRLRAGGDESGLVGSKCGFAIPHIFTDCGLKNALVCELVTYC